MNNQGKKVRFFLLLIIFQLAITASVISATENVGSEVLFEKHILDGVNKHRLLVTKIILNRGNKLCDDTGKCNTAIINAQYFKNNKIIWSHEDSVNDCSYDITLKLFSNDIIIDVSNGNSDITIGYEKLCSLGFDPTTVIVAGYSNNAQYVVSSGDTQNNDVNKTAFALLKKLVSQRETHFLDSDEPSDNSQSMINMTNANERENRLLIKIQEDILPSFQLSNINKLKNEISKWRYEVAKYCEEQYQEGSVRFLEQYSCLNNYQIQLIKVLNDRLNLYPSECPLSADVHTAVASHVNFAAVLCKGQEASCFAEIDQRLASGVDNLEYCVPGWLTELKSNYAYRIQEKSYLYKSATEKHKTKMYLLEGDKVNILGEKTDDTGWKWYYISYKGKKELKMWIKVAAVDTNPVYEQKERTEAKANAQGGF